MKSAVHAHQCNGLAQSLGARMLSAHVAVDAPVVRIERRGGRGTSATAWGAQVTGTQRTVGSVCASQRSPGSALVLLAIAAYPEFAVLFLTVGTCVPG